MARIPWITLFPIIAIPLIGVAVYFFGGDGKCDLVSEVDQRDFFRFYGVGKVKHNPFSLDSAENERSLDSPFYSVITLPTPTTTVVLGGERGTGKSRVREELLKGISKHPNILVVKLLGNLERTNRYLKNYIADTEDTTLSLFESRDILQMILLEATPLLSEKLVKYDLPGWSHDRKTELALLLSMYCVAGSRCTGVVRDAVNHLVDNRHATLLRGRQIGGNSIESNPQIKFWRKQFNRFYKTLRVMPDSVSDDALEIVQTHDMDPTDLLEQLPLQHVQTVMQAVTALKMRVLVVVDSLDESKAIFASKGNSEMEPGQSIPDAAAPETPVRLQNFLKAITIDMLPLSQGSAGMIFHVYMPTMSGFDFEASTKALRKDKIFTRHLTWTYGDLLNYADTMFAFMRRRGAMGRRRCEKLPSFTQLVGGPEQARRVLCHIRHPRNLAQFFRTLTEQLKSVCTQRSTPFIATPHDVDVALDNAKLRFIFDSEEPIVGCSLPEKSAVRWNEANEDDVANEREEVSRGYNHGE